MGWSALAVTDSIVMVMCAALPAAASAEDQDTSEELHVLQTVTDSATDSDTAHQEVLSDLADPAEVDTGRDGSVSLETGNAKTVIPAVSDEPIVLDDVKIGMPSPAVAAESERVDDSIVSFDNEDGSSTVPVLKSDGSVQITTIIDDTSAPSVYEYDLALPDGATINIDETGFVTASTGDKFVVGVAPAWAVDATGLEVPTHYELEGTTLRQVVDHHAGDFTYPIVADPWLGTRLFDRVWASGNQKVSLITSAWGRMVQITGGGFGWGTGQLVLNGAGWSEAVSAVGWLTSKATYYQQYQCHVLGAYTPASGGPTWDLEGYRGNRPWWRTDGGAFPYKCNWP